MGPLDILKKIQTQNPIIDSFVFATFPRKTLLQEDLELSPADKVVVNNALEIRRMYSLPFWDSIMLCTFEECNISDNLFKRALLHNKNENHLLVSQVSQAELMVKEHPELNVSLTSSIHLNDKTIQHLPLLDFHIFPSVNNLRVTVKVLKALDLHGYILDSGKSYHFIGNQIFDESGLIDFLAQALLFSPIIDRAWIAHQMLERSCSIRVSSKMGITPRLVQEV